MFWFILGLFIGGVLGMIILALVSTAKETDKHFNFKNREDIAECFWCGERMASIKRRLAMSTLRWAMCES
jgi:hypothetical protein